MPRTSPFSITLTDAERVEPARLDTPRQVVSKWRKRFYEHRLAGLADLPRGGRPPSFSP